MAVKSDHRAFGRHYLHFLTLRKERGGANICRHIVNGNELCYTASWSIGYPMRNQPT